MHVQDVFSYPGASQKKKGQSYLLFAHTLNLLSFQGLKGHLSVLSARIMNAIDINCNVL